MKNGFGGFIYADAANNELFEMFIKNFGAIPIATREYPYRFMLDGESVSNILDIYNFDWR